MSLLRAPVLLAAPLCLVLALAAAGCGSDDDSSPFPFDIEADGTPSAASPEPADGDEQGAEESLLLSSFQAAETEPPELPAGPASSLGGTPRYAAAEAIKQMLEDIGVPLDGIDVYVLPVQGADSTLLVLEADSAAVAADDSEAPEDVTPALSALVESEAVKAANVTRVVLNLRAEDEQGPFVFTMTMPLKTLPAMVEGTLTEEETAEQLRIGVQRP